MPVTDYSKWDAIEDSDEEEAPAPKGRVVDRAKPNASGEPMETKQATVSAGFIIKTTALVEPQRPAYINVCISSSVPGTMRAAASSGGLDATLPYIVGDVREDVDRDRAACYVVECMFSPDTLAAYDRDRRSAETVIHTALGVVADLAMPVDKVTWSLFEPAELREVSGRYFFPPGRLRVAEADDDLSGVE